MGQWVIQGGQNVADIYFRNQPQNSELFLGLIANDIPSTLDLSYADLTWITEPSASTYARVPMAASSWIEYGAVVTYPEIEFEVTIESLGTIYGCFIATKADSTGKLLAIHRLSTPAVLEYYGDRIAITPQITIS